MLQGHPEFTNKVEKMLNPIKPKFRGVSSLIGSAVVSYVLSITMLFCNAQHITREPIGKVHFNICPGYPKLTKWKRMIKEEELDPLKLT